MPIEIRGLGVLTDEEWERLSPDADAHRLLSSDSGSGELWMGETPEMEDFRFVPQELRGMPSGFYTPERFDVRIDLYGSCAKAADGVDEFVYALWDSHINGWDAEAFGILGDAVAETVFWLDVGKRVVVNCQAGLNRSGLVSALALMEWAGLTADEAINLIHARRSPLCLVNASFVAFLKEKGQTFLDELFRGNE